MAIHNRLSRWSMASSLAGGGIWLAMLGAWGSGIFALGLIELLFLLAPLVIVPLALGLVAAGGAKAPLPLRVARRLQPFAALLTASSFCLPASRAAGVLAVSWLMITGLLAVGGLTRLWRRRVWPLHEATIDAGLMLSTIGAVNLVSSRLGLLPLGFQEPLIILAAVHFTYAGLVTPLLIGFAGRFLSPQSSRLRKLLAAAAACVVMGTPMMGAGYVLSPHLKFVAAFMLLVGLWLLSAVHFGLLPRIQNEWAQYLLALSAASPLIAMVFAAIYEWGEFTGERLIPIPTMTLIHGLTQGVGFALCGVLAWALAGPYHQTRQAAPTSDA